MKLWMPVLYNLSVRPFLKEGNSISAECNSIKETKIHRWASSVKSRGSGIRVVRAFFPLYQENLLVTTSNKQEIKSVGE